jgi:Flp pilus assembly protein TadG
MRFRRSTKGGALLELAVVFPVLLLLLIGVVDYGRMYFTSVAVANAARAGAEWGAFSPTNSVNDSGMQSFAALDGAEVAGNFQITSRHYCRC